MVKSILYVTTQITGTWRYFSWCSYPDIGYARLQKKIIMLGLKNPDSDFSIKFYPKDHVKNPNIDFVQGYPTLKVLTQSLTDILKDYTFDLIITEACATTLLEILCTKSQVLLLAPGDFVKIDRHALDLLKKRVFVAETEIEYLELAKLLLSSEGALEEKPLDDDFLFTYGIGSPMHDPKELAIMNINRIISEPPHETFRHD